MAFILTKWREKKKLQQTGKKILYLYLTPPYSQDDIKKYCCKDVHLKLIELTWTVHAGHGCTENYKYEYYCLGWNNRSVTRLLKGTCLYCCAKACYLLKKPLASLWILRIWMISKGVSENKLWVIYLKRHKHNCQGKMYSWCFVDTQNNTKVPRIISYTNDFDLVEDVHKHLTRSVYYTEQEDRQILVLWPSPHSGGL